MIQPRAPSYYISALSPITSPLTFVFPLESFTATSFLAQAPSAFFFFLRQVFSPSLPRRYLRKQAGSPSIGQAIA